MIFYLLFFSVSLFFIHQAEKYNRDRMVFAIFSLMAILPPILLASLRDSNVGSDTTFYQIPIWEDAITFRGNWAIFIIRHPNSEIGYLFINYIISLFTKNIFYLYFFLYSLIIVPLYITAMLWRKILSPVLFMGIFYLVCYNELLSTVRQGIVMSLAMLAFNCYLKKQYKKFALLFIVSLCFHNTAIIPFLFPFIYKFLCKYPPRKYYGCYFLVSIIFFIVVANFDNLLLYIIGSNIIPAKYIVYTSQGDTFQGDIGVSNLIVKILIVIYIFIIIKMRKKNIPIVLFFFVMSIMDFSFSLLGGIINHLIRLSLYPRIITCISLPFLFKNNPLYLKDGINKHKIPIKTLFVLLLFFYWYHVYIYGDFASTSDYQFNSKLI